MKLTKRLETIAKLVAPGGIVVDVGCDHGLLCLYLLSNNLASHCIACDISAKCLDKVPLVPSLSKRLGNGLSVIKLDEKVHTIVISGMGGLNICEILKDYFDRLVAANIDTHGLQIVVSPQSNVEDVRCLLLSYSLDIVTDFVLKDYKFYDIIKAASVKPLACLPLSDVSETKLRYGMFCDQPNFDLKQKLTLLLDKCNLAKQRVVCDAKLLEKIAQINEVLKWQ